MTQFETTLTDGRAAKLTITADGEVRVKIPQSWTPEDGAAMQAYFTKVVAVAPKLGKTLRGSARQPAPSFVLHTGTTKNSIVHYKITIE